jgi:hypothetical protein
VKQSGYGQPLPGKFKGEGLHSLTDGRWMDVVEPFSSDRQVVAAGPSTPACKRMVEFGNGNYETKYMCAALDNEDSPDECHLLSVGSNDQWGFEEAVQKKLPHCKTHTFDCTLNGPPKRKPKDAHFYDMCIGEKDGDPKYKGYADFHNATGMHVTPRYLKIDVEGFDYRVFLESILSAPSHLWPEQMIFFGTLFNHGGYMPVRIETIKGCKPCLEILLMRVIC